LAAAAGRDWDGVLDTCGYVPRQVREVAEVLGDRTAHYTFVSSLSVLPDAVLPGADDTTPTFQPPFPDTEEINDVSYGPLKVACEREARDGFAGRCLILRPGYIVGPFDPLDRFTSWVRRAAAGGEMLCPGPSDEVLQIVDARDLATFTLDGIEARTTDVFGVAGPGETLTWGSALRMMCDVGGAGTRLTWVDGGFLRSELGEGRWEALPMWDATDASGLPGFDASRAIAAGLWFRPLSETVRDTLAWDQARSGSLTVGLTAQRERELLDAWRAASA
jgi:2'-hydroxyisoflavone reductase